MLNLFPSNYLGLYLLHFPPQNTQVPMRTYFLACFLMYTCSQALSGQTTLGKGLSLTDTAQQHLLALHSGNQFFGRLMFINNDTLGFHVENTTDTLLLLLPQVRYVGLRSTPSNQIPGENYIPQEKQDGARAPVAAPLTHLLFDGTALPPHHKGMYRNTLVLFHQVDAHLGKNVSVGAGGFIPGLILARIQVRASLSEIIHIGAVFQTGLLLIDGSYLTIPYSIITLGTHRQYINLTYGLWRESYFDSGGSSRYRKIGLAASHSFNEKWRAYIEAAIVTGEYDTEVVPSFNVSHHRRRSSFDMGLVNISGAGVPLIPFVSYGYVF